MKRLFFALLLLVIAHTANAQSEFKGSDWSKWNESVKAMYIVGWVDGSAHAFWETLGAIDWERRLRVAKKGIASDPDLAKTECNVTVGQIMTWTDDLFSEPKNANIEVRTAVSMAHGELRGFQMITEEYLQKIRRIESQNK